MLMVGVQKYRKAAPRKTEASGVGKNGSIRFLHDQPLNEGSVMLSTEEVPLDNRFGSSVLMSEHEFVQAATSSLKIDQSSTSSRRLQVSWALLEGELNGQISRSLGVEIGSQITRRVNLKFEAAAGKFVLYRIVWKQNSRKGLAEIELGTQIVQVPYEVIYGLYHSVESLSTHN